MDELVIKKAKAGDEQAFEIIFSENYTRLWRFVYSRSSNREETQDIVSECFISLWSKLVTGKINSSKPESIIAYLYTSARNRIKQFYRDKEQGAIPLINTLLGKEDEDIQESTESVDRDSSLIMDVLRSFSEDYSDVLRLRIIAGLSVRDTSEILGLSESNVKTILSRALTKLRSKYEILNNTQN